MSAEELENQERKETIDPHSISIVTTTSYPDWVKDGTSGSITQVRGDAVIDMAKAAQKNGYQMIVVDGTGNFASPLAYIEEIKNLGVKVLKQEEPGMAASRRQVIKAGSESPNVEVVIWTEEKPSLEEDNSPRTLAGPILSGHADIIIYDRGKKGMETYNKSQSDWEIRANKTADKILVAQGLKPEGSPQLDLWSGPRAIKNTPEIIGLFMQKYRFKKVESESGRAVEIHKRINPERWSNSIFLPVIAALYQGYHVVSQPITYVHRQIMNDSENNDPRMLDKRKTQFTDIINNSVHFIHYLKGREISRISPIK